MRERMLERGPDLRGGFRVDEALQIPVDQTQQGQARLVTPFERALGPAVTEIRAVVGGRLDEAAREIADGLESGRPEIVFPWPMAVTMKLARLLPVRAWTVLSSRLAGRA